MTADGHGDDSIAATARERVRWPYGFARRFLMLLALGLVWLVPAWWYPGFVALMLLWDLAVVLAWIWDLTRLPAPDRIIIERSWPEELELGAPGRVTIRLKHQGACSLDIELVDDIAPALRADPPQLSLRAAAGENAAVSYEIRPSERGEHHAGRVFIRYQSALGLAQRWAAADLGRELLVYPNLETPRAMTLHLVRSRQIDVERRFKRQRGEGREFESLRQYRQGDAWRDVCWTASARSGKLIAKSYQAERNQAVWLLVDSGRLLRARVSGSSKLDHAVNAALCLAFVALHSGDRVGLMSYTRRVTQRLPAARGSRHLRDIARSLAHVRAETSEADHALAADHLLGIQRTRGLVVWLTDLAETATTPEVIESALRVMKRHMVVMVLMGQPEVRRIVSAPPDSIDGMYQYVAALEMIQRRELLLRTMRGQGAFTIDCDPGRLPTAMVNRYLEIKERGLL